MQIKKIKENHFYIKSLNLPTPEPDSSVILKNIDHIISEPSLDEGTKFSLNFYQSPSKPESKPFKINTIMLSRKSTPKKMEVLPISLLSERRKNILEMKNSKNQFFKNESINSLIISQKKSKVDKLEPIDKTLSMKKKKAEMDENSFKENDKNNIFHMQINNVYRNSLLNHFRKEQKIKPYFFLYGENFIKGKSANTTPLFKKV